MKKFLFFVLLVCGLSICQAQITLAEWNPSCNGNAASMVEGGITAGAVSIATSTCSVECFGSGSEGAVRGRVGDDGASFTYTITFTGGPGSVAEINYTIERSSTGYQNWEVTLDGNSLGSFSKTSTGETNYVLDVNPDVTYAQGATATLVFSPSNYNGSNNSCAGSGGTFRVIAPEFLGDVTLPVELSSFTATDKNGIVELNWSTASEINNSHFEVQKSTDGRNFDVIGTVKGMGTTNIEQNYSFAAEIIRNQVNYFRLKQMDYDGAFEFSPVVVLKSKESSEDKIEVYLSSHSELVVNVSEESEYVIRDGQGRLVLQGEVIDNRVDVSALVDGIYFISVLNNDINQTRRFLK